MSTAFSEENPADHARPAAAGFPRPTLRAVPRGHAEDWAAAIEAWLRWLAAGNLAPGTLRQRRHYLEHLARTVAVGPWSVTFDDLTTFMAARPRGPETLKSIRASFRSFYGWAVETGATGEDPSRPLRPVRVPAGRPRPAPEEVLAAALAKADRRERLMVMLGAYAGLRCIEIASVHTRDVINGVLWVRGKGSKVRLIPLHPVLLAELAKLPAGFVFPGNREGHLSAQYVGKMLRRLMDGRWSAHTLRHRFASQAYDGTRDLRAVQELLGHAKPETTARYTAVPAGALHDAVMAAGPAGPLPAFPAAYRGPSCDVAPAAIRTWARAHGVPISAAGPLPASARAAYDAAHRAGGSPG